MVQSQLSMRKLFFFWRLAPLLLFIFIFFNFNETVSAQTIESSENQLTCQVHPFLVDSGYELPFGYDAPQIVNGSTVNDGDSIVYVFDVKNQTTQDRVNIKKVTATQLLGNNEPIEIMQVYPQNGSCTIGNNKSIICNINYSFADSAHYPIEYLFTISNRNQQPKTSTLFNIETDAGNTSCASMLMIKNNQKPNSINWSTAYAKLISGDFYIKLDGNKYYGKDPVKITSDPAEPGDTRYTTLESIWQENGVEMRLFLYFRSITTESTWELYEIRSYDGTKPGEWIYYKSSSGKNIQGTIGIPDQAAERRFVSTSGRNAEIVCKNCKIEAFMPTYPPITNSGYYLEILIGLPLGEDVSLTTNPNDGFGVATLLHDKNNDTVTSQEQFEYIWEAENPSIVSVKYGGIYQQNGCAYGINKPCPNSYAFLEGKQAGKTKVKVTVFRKIDKVVIATKSINVSVKEYGSTTPFDNDEFIALEKRIDNLQSEVKNQQGDINSMQKGLTKIIAFLQQFFSSLFK